MSAPPCRTCTFLYFSCPSYSARPTPSWMVWCPNYCYSPLTIFVPHFPDFIVPVLFPPERPLPSHPLRYRTRTRASSFPLLLSFDTRYCWAFLSFDVCLPPPRTRPLSHDFGVKCFAARRLLETKKMVTMWDHRISFVLHLPPIQQVYLGT